MESESSVSAWSWIYYDGGTVRCGRDSVCVCLCFSFFPSVKLQNFVSSTRTTGVNIGVNGCLSLCGAALGWWTVQGVTLPSPGDCRNWLQRLHQTKPKKGEDEVVVAIIPDCVRIGESLQFNHNVIFCCCGWSSIQHRLPGFGSYSFMLICKTYLQILTIGPKWFYVFILKCFK